MTAWKDSRGKWRYRFQINKIRYSGEQSYQTKKQAEKAEWIHRQKIETIEQQDKNHDTTFGEIAEQYLDYVERSMTKETYRQKVRTYQAFLKLYPDIKIKDVTSERIINYLSIYKSNDQYNRHRKEMSAVLEYAKNIFQCIHSNPVSKIPKLPHSPQQKIIPTEKQIISLLLACDPQKDERELLLCVMLTLARIDEILRLKWQDINFEQRKLIKWTKKRKDAQYASIVIPINNDLYEVLWQMWEKRVQEVWVFYNKKTKDRYKHRPRFMRGLCKRAGIDPPFGFHALRHYMSSLLADNKKISTKTIQDFLGHQSIKTTEIYLHSIDSSSEEAMQNLNGIFDLNEHLKSKKCSDT